jgi:hypothetical protein
MHTGRAPCGTPSENSEGEHEREREVDVSWFIIL